MSDSESDGSEQGFNFFGTPLDPIDKDEIPRKKPISVEEQIATDSHGRRRFHGAFTGGFSAGFFNTVGSLEGWTPNEFKSSRGEKAHTMVQKPEDFMDDEDMGEFGIAPQTIRATKDYSTAKKRKRTLAKGPIPGEPVLETFINAGNDTIGYLLLKNIGIQDKIARKSREQSAGSVKVYGCAMPDRCEMSDDMENKLYIMPKIYTNCLANPKGNTFGMGYKGLDRSINTSSSTSLLIKAKNNKNVHFTGQAFGVGAFEEDDGDIYSKDDMSNYDFELTSEKTRSRDGGYNSNLVYNIFKKNKTPLLCKKQFPTINIPSGFTGKHKVRISRFEPVKENPETTYEKPKINLTVRARYLGEPELTASTSSQTDVTKNIKTDTNINTTKPGDSIQALLCLDRFVSASHKEEVNNILEPVQRMSTCFGTQQMQDAVKMKMFGPLTRTTSDWHPCALLCERFNVPEPFTDQTDFKQHKRRKNLIFEQQTFSEESSISKGGISEAGIKSEAVDDNRGSTESTTSSQTSTDAEKESSEVNKSYGIEAAKNMVTHCETINQGTVPQSDECKNNIGDADKNDNVKDITEKINIAEKVDLFKAVFLSSDDESEEETEAFSEDRNDLVETVLSEPLIPLVRNAKQGILSNLSFNNLSGESSTVTPEIKEVKIDVNGTSSVTLYGPSLPVQKIKQNVTNIHISSDSNDEWIEKDESKHKKHKSKKKKSKDKKHKKHKKH